MTVSVVKSEQYSRRDVVNVVGLPLVDGLKSLTDLSTKVAQVLSQSGEDVKPNDFSAYHRNLRNKHTASGKTLPPSETVKFIVISKKDNVLDSKRKKFSILRQEYYSIWLSCRICGKTLKLLELFLTTNSHGRNKEMYNGSEQSTLQYHRSTLPNE